MRSSRADWLRRTVRLVILLGSVSLMTGCHTFGSVALWGAGIGALAGQIIGGNTESTVLGASIGALMGVDAAAGHAGNGHHVYLHHYNAGPTRHHYSSDHGHYYYDY